MVWILHPREGWVGCGEACPHIPLAFGVLGAHGGGKQRNHHRMPHNVYLKMQSELPEAARAAGTVKRGAEALGRPSH